MFILVRFHFFLQKIASRGFSQGDVLRTNGLQQYTKVACIFHSHILACKFHFLYTFSGPHNLFLNFWLFILGQEETEVIILRLDVIKILFGDYIRIIPILISAYRLLANYGGELVQSSLI